jgi:4'-phosphopantetheinyl transferase EntD
VNDILGLIQSFLPPGVALAGGAVEPIAPSMFGVEEDAISRAVPMRRYEFRTGRALVRTALGLLGFAPCPIPVGAFRQPVWPKGIVGAITHSGEFAAVVAARATDFYGLGVDVEQDTPLDADLVRLVCRPEEHPSVGNPGPIGIDVPKLLLVVKEAVYKAYFPNALTFLEFEDVSVTLDTRTQAFRAALVPQSKPALAGIREVEGRFGVAGGYLAAFVGVAAT